MDLILLKSDKHEKNNQCYESMCNYVSIPCKPITQCHMPMGRIRWRSSYRNEGIGHLFTVGTFSGFHWSLAPDSSILQPLYPVALASNLPPSLVPLSCSPPRPQPKACPRGLWPHPPALDPRETSLTLTPPCSSIVGTFRTWAHTDKMAQELTWKSGPH